MEHTPGVQVIDSSSMTMARASTVEVLQQGKTRSTEYECIYEDKSEVQKVYIGYNAGYSRPSQKDVTALEGGHDGERYDNSRWVDGSQF